MIPEQKVLQNARNVKKVKMLMYIHVVKNQVSRFCKPSADLHAAHKLICVKDGRAVECRRCVELEVPFVSVKCFQKSAGAESLMRESVKAENQLVRRS